VSAFEPQLPSEPKVDMPDFMIVLRGFDRRQVEMWAAEVANQIEQERLRADEAEKRAYRAQIEGKGGAPSFSHLGSHVASILEEASKSSENMLADAADRAQETVHAAEAEAAEIIKAAEHRAGEIEGDARQILEAARSEGARVEEDALLAGRVIDDAAAEFPPVGAIHHERPHRVGPVVNSESKGHGYPPDCRPARAFSP